MVNFENCLLSQLDLLDQILASSIDLIYVYDRAGCYLYASPAGLAVIGRRAEEVVGKHWRELGLFAEAMERHDAEREAVFQTGVVFKGETSYPTVDGTKYYEYVISPILGQEGEIEAVINTGRDITKRKQAEEALRLLTEELEARVQTRTQELTDLNASLCLEIAEHQKTERALRESEMRFSVLLDAMFEGIVIQEHGTIIEANHGFANLFGYSLEEVIGKSAVDFLTPESLKILFQHVENQYELPYEVTGIKKDGTLINLEVVGKQSFYQGRSVRVSAARDITDRKRAETTLQNNQIQIQEQLAEIETIYQSAPIGLNFLDTDLRFVRINQQLAEMNGLPVEAHIGRTIREVLPDLADTAEQLLRPILETGEPLLNVEITGETPAQPGVQRTWLESFLPLKSGERIIGISTVCEEITERKRAETERIQLLQQEQADRAEIENLLQQLEAERSRLEQILQQMPVGVSIAEAPSGKTIYHNEEAIRLLRHPLLNSETYQHYVQYGAMHIEGDSRYPYQPEEYPLAHSLLTGEVVKAEEMHYCRGDGTMTLISVSAAPILDKNGQIIAAVSTFEDISDRKRVNQELKSVHDSLNFALAAAEMGTWDLDLVNDTARRNLRHDQIFGYDTLQPEWGHEIAKRHAHPEDLSKFDEGFQQGLRTGEFQFEARIIWSNQSLHWINVIGHVYYDESHQPVRMAGIVMDVTDRKQAEVALRQSEEQLRLAFDFAQIGHWDWDISTNEITWNSVHFHLLGLDLETTATNYQNWRDRVHPEDVGQIEVAIQDALQTHSPYVAEYRVIRPDGSLCWVFGKGQAIYDASGQPIRMLGVLLDITDRKQAEQALQEREALLRLFAQYAPAGIAMFDRSMRYIMTSQRWAEDYHLVSVESLIGRSHYEVFPEISERWKQIHQRCSAGAIEKCEEDLFVRADGVQQWIRWEVRPWHMATGEVGGIIIFSEDITDRKRAEQALRESEERYRTLAQNFPNGAVLLFDHDLRYVLAEGQGLADVGLDRTMLEGKTIWEAFDSETCRFLEPHFREALAGNSQVVEMSFDDRFYSVHCLPVRDDQGLVALGMAVSQNITLQKQAEQVLKTARDELERQVQARTRELQQVNEILEQREREFRTLVENTPDVITRHDRQYRCLYINPASTQSIGMPPAFFIGKKPSELGYPEDVAQFWENSLESVFVTGEMRIDEFTIMNENVPRSYQVCVVPEREADHAVVSVMTIGRDITKLRQAEEATRQLAEELQRSNQELEQFAYVASHDLQEPLRAITSFTQLLEKRYRGQLDAKADTYIEFIVDGAIRMQQLVRDLLTYSRTGRYELSPQAIDCNTLLERVKQNLQVAIAENHAVITAEPLPTITADSTQITNLLQNLISNSLKYRSEAEPQIYISAKITTLGIDDTPSQGSNLLMVNPNGAWLFSIRDNGIGIDPQYSERIFGIFQRLHTSDEYSGTGLGLAICKKIIERHGGRIWVESQLGHGSTFCFTVPIPEPQT